MPSSIPHVTLAVGTADDLNRAHDLGIIVGLAVSRTSTAAGGPPSGRPGTAADGTTAAD